MASAADIALAFLELQPTIRQSPTTNANTAKNRLFIMLLLDSNILFHQPIVLWPANPGGGYRFL